MNDKLDTYIGNVKHLPATPTVLVKMIALFQQPDRDLDEVIELMRQDPSLTAEVLRHSNSAGFSHGEPIVEVFEAVSRIGFYELYHTVTARLASQVLHLPPGVCSDDVEKLWRHSATAGVAAGVIGRRVQENEGLAFTAGLLHDTGKIVLAWAEGARYKALTDEVGTGGPVLQAAEAKHFGFGHAEIGARLLERWGLPASIAVPVKHHHQALWPKSAERICAVVTLANIMAHAAEAAVPGKQYVCPEAGRAMRLLELDKDDLALLLQDAQNEIARMTELLGTSR